MRAFAALVALPAVAGCGGSTGASAGALRVQVIDVSTALTRVAAHHPTPSLHAVGARCTAPARGDGIGRPWSCSVTYRGSPQRSLAYRLVVRANGCWLATPASEGTGPLRTIGPRYRGCGLAVK